MNTANSMQTVFTQRRLNIHNNYKDPSCDFIVVTITVRNKKQKMLKLLQQLARRRDVIEMEATKSCADNKV